MIGLIVGAWLTARSGRKVRVKIGDVELEAGTAEEVERLLSKVEQFRREIAPHDGAED
ncbi:MAG: hypothetical protein WDM81_20635 [Rhizomicrobium sp.]